MPQDLPNPASHTQRRERITGIDLARMLAIIGMITVHLAPNESSLPYKILFAMPSGRASILFVLVAGIGVTLLTSSRSGSSASARLKLAWRALLLLPAGLLLQELGHGVWVILQSYSLFFLLGMLVYHLPDRQLLTLTSLFAVIGPLISLTGQTMEPNTFDQLAVSFSDPVPVITHGILLSGAYPLITWAAPFLLGIWLGRLDMKSKQIRIRFIVGGGCIMILAFGLSMLLIAATGSSDNPEGWLKIISSAPHSQMPLWLYSSTGAAVMVLGLSLIAADALGRLAWPLVVTGQLPLTVYIAHLIDLHWRREIISSMTAEGAFFTLLTITAVAVLFSLLWRSKFSKGPFEALMHYPILPVIRLQKKLAARN